MGAMTKQEANQREAVVQNLREIGVRGGVLHTMAKSGQLMRIRCETPKCYRSEGRGFPRPLVSNSPWSPTVDHSPTLKSNGGHKDTWNVRLAHKLCNSEDAAWRKRINRMIKSGRSLQQMAEELNAKGVQCPKGSGQWTTSSVRWSFASS